MDKQYLNMTLDELKHSGILGQKWGVRNGPPYPLDAEDHNAREKAKGTSGWTKEAKEDEKKKSHLSDKQKKYLKIGAGIVAGALVAYGGYKLYQNRDRLSKEMKLGRKNVDFIRNSGKFDYLNTEGFGNSGIDHKMVSKINEANKNSYGGIFNCTHCSISYILNTKFGMNTTAKPFSGVDEVSGLVNNSRPKEFLHLIFDNIDRKDISESTFDNFSKKIKNGSQGCLGLYNIRGNGHMINYEKSKNGILTLIDSQTGNVYNYSDSDIKKVFNSFYNGSGIIYDLSNASLKDKSKDILKYIINS